eukprot:scaffold302303_cov75-Attheya_sp.AAC.1
MDCVPLFDVLLPQQDTQRTSGLEYLDLSFDSYPEHSIECAASVLGNSMCGLKSLHITGLEDGKILPLLSCMQLPSAIDFGCINMLVYAYVYSFTIRSIKDT